MSSSKCYYPDGSDASADSYPCWNTSASSTDFAPCCLNVDYCVSSGWCLSTNSMTTYRAGCTDQSWQSDSCVKQCTGAKLGGIFKCDDLGHSACQASECGTADQFLVASGNMLLSGPKMTSALAASSFVRAADLNASTATATFTVIASSSSACSLDVGDDGAPRNLIAAVGLGVGVPLILALLISLYFLSREKRRSKAQRYEFAQLSKQSYPVFVATPGELRSELAVGTRGQSRAYQQRVISTRYELSPGFKPAELGVRHSAMGTRTPTY